MVLAQRYPIERVASAIVTVWGLCLILTTVCKNYQGLYAQRFFLGLIESGVSPMFMMIVVSSHTDVVTCPFAELLDRDPSTGRTSKLSVWGE